jgi:hypothetical protein
VLVGFLGVALALPAVGQAMPRTESRSLTTHIPSTTYSANTTWTLASSPYVLDGSVTVAAGVTLTIEPGVIVKFNGAARELRIDGTLSAAGTSASPIVFTSLQDDSVGGDTGGDGPTSGSNSGQWHDIYLWNGGHATLSYVDVRYGGYGGTGVLNVSDNSSLTLQDSTIEHNGSAGVRAQGSTMTAMPHPSERLPLRRRKPRVSRAFGGWS